MSNIGTYFVNLCADPETIKMGERECTKLRVADNTGQRHETRFFDVILGQERDIEKANRLAKGDRIAVHGQLTKDSYKAKKDGKGVKKGQVIYTDSMPFATILEVIKSPSFFSDSEEEPGEAAGGDDSAPDLDEGSDKPAADPLDI